MEKKWEVVKALNDDLQEALEKSDTEVHELLQELESLEEKNKSLNEEKNSFLDLIKEADNLKLSLIHYKNAEHKGHQERKAVERKCLLMKDKADQLSHQISVSEEMKSVLCDYINQLKHRVVNLENDLAAIDLELKEKDNLAQERESMTEDMVKTVRHYSAIKEALNSRIQELQSQLEDSDQEIAMSDSSEDDALISNPEGSGRIMYEIIQSRMETQLELAHLQRERQGQGYLWMRLPLLMLQQSLWYSFSICFLLLLVFIFMRLYHVLYPDSTILDVCNDVSSQIVKAVKKILGPYLKWRGPEVPPS